MQQFFKKMFYSFSGLPVINYLGRSGRGRATVLCYHRVLPDDKIELDDSPNAELIMPLSKFIEQMKFLSETQQVVSMDGLVSHLESDSDSFVVAVTFDDGYKDNLDCALPILEKYNIPATVYITTRFPEGDSWMWWYEIWDYLKKNDNLEFTYKEKFYKYITNTIEQKEYCFNSLRGLILKLEYSDQKKFVETLTKDPNRKQYPVLCLGWDEIKQLGQSSVVTVGAHTHTHTNLKILTDNDVCLELDKSKSILEKELNCSVEHCAYPFGTCNEVGQREFKLAAKVDFKTAVTTYPEKIDQVSLYSIPRLGVPPYLTLRGFKGKLSGWEYLVRKLLGGKEPCTD